MKKRMKQILAMFLAAAMILQQGGMAETITGGTVLADEAPAWTEDIEDTGEASALTTEAAPAAQTIAETAEAPVAVEPVPAAEAAPEETGSAPTQNTEEAAPETDGVPAQNIEAPASEETDSAPAQNTEIAPESGSAPAQDTEIASETGSAPAQDTEIAPESGSASGQGTEPAPQESEPELVLEPEYVRPYETEARPYETETIPAADEANLFELKLDNSDQTAEDETIPHIALELTRPEGFPADVSCGLEVVQDEEKTRLTAETDMDQAEGLVLRFFVEQNGSACDLSGAQAVFDGLDDDYLTGSRLFAYREGEWKEQSALFFEENDRTRASFSIDRDGILFFQKAEEPETEELETEESDAEQTEKEEPGTEAEETDAEEPETEESGTEELETEETDAEQTEIEEPGTETEKTDTEQTEELWTEAEESGTEQIEEPGTEIEEADTEEMETEPGTSEPEAEEQAHVMSASLTEDPIMPVAGDETEETETDSVYEIYYVKDKELVFQSNPDPDPERGNLVQDTDYYVYHNDGGNPKDTKSGMAANEWEWIANQNVQKNIETVTFKEYVPLKSLQNMFNGCSSLKTVKSCQDIAREAESIARVFNGCGSLECLDLSTWDTSNVTNMGYMFNGCTKLADLNVSTWNTQKVNNLNQTFQGCTLLKTVDVSKWELTISNNMMWTFNNCTALTTLDLSGWGVNGAQMGGLFNGCTSLSRLTLGENFYFSTKNGSANLTGTWIRESDKKEFTGAKLMETYPAKNAEIAGTYLRAIPISFYTNDGTNNASTIDRYIGAIFAADDVQVPVRAGYEFDGWWTDKEGGKQLTNGDPITQTAYYAHWKKCTVYEIFYKKTGELVFQDTDVVDPNKVTLDSSGEPNADEYTIYNDDGSNALSNTTNPSEADWAFHGIRGQIKTVTFRDNVKLQTVQFIFKNCTALRKVNIGKFTASGITSIAQAFRNCTELTSLDLSEWDVSAAKNIGHVFQGCTNLRSLNLTGWSTESVENLFETFEGCSSLTSLDISQWKTEKVTNMLGTFSGCISLTELDLSGWDTTKVSDNNMKAMFGNCPALSRLILGADFTFWGETGVNNAGLIGFWQNEETQVLFTAEQMMKNEAGAGTYIRPRVYEILYTSGELVIQNDDTVDLSKGDVYRVYEDDGSGAIGSDAANDAWAFDEDKSRITSVTFRDKDIKLGTLRSIFKGCTNLEKVDTGEYTAAGVTSLGWAFSGCTNLTSLDLSGWDTSSVTYMGRIFQNCRKLSSLNIAGWNTEKVTNLYETFQNCESLTALDDISAWNTAAVTNMISTFAGCTSLKELHLGKWSTSAISLGDKNMENMFQKCEDLVQLDLGKDFWFTNTNAGLTGEWKRGSKDEKIYDAADLMAEYKKENAANMADSYYRVARITFNGNGGVANPQGIDGYLNMTIEELPTAKREGYEFLGWFTKRVDGEPLEKGDKVQQLTYYAHWKPYTYTLRLHGQNGKTGEDGIRTETLTFDQFYQLSETLFTNGDKLLIGWNTKSNGQGQMYGPNARVSGLADQNGSEVTLYAIWGDPDDYVTLSFDSQGGSDVPSMRFKRGEKAQHLPQPTWEGYLFDCWAYKQDGTLQLSESSFVEMTKDITLYAQWLKYYTARFIPHEGGEEEAITAQTTKKTPLGALPKLPQREDGSVLMGWFTEDDVQAEAGKTYLTEDTNFYARWGWKPQFDAAGGEFTSVPKYLYAEDKSAALSYELSELPEVRKDGYTFKGWYLENGTPVKAGSTVDLTAHKRITAHWELVQTVQVQLDPGGGTVNGKKDPVTINAYAGKRLGDLPIPERAGYVFLGWFDEEKNELCSRETTFDADKKITAHWAEEVYVTFMSGDDVVERIPVAQGGTIPVLPGANNSDAAYPVLEGWYTAPDGKGEKLTTDTVIDEDMIYYAKWDALRSQGTVDNISYTYSVAWESASNENVDRVGDCLVFHPTDTAEQTATLNVYFMSNMESQGNAIPKGAVRIKIPKQVWKDWDGNLTGTCNISNELEEYKEGVELSGDKYFTYTEEGEYYILTNNRPINGGAGLNIQISYTVDPTTVPGGGIDTAGNYVTDGLGAPDGPKYYHGEYPVTITIDNTDKSVEPTEITKNFSIEMHTRVRTSASKEFSKIRYSYVWQKEWGPEPEDADDYFYIEWKLKETVQSTANQPFTFTWSEEDTVHDGTVVGITNPSVSVKPDGYRTYYNDQKVVVKYPLSMLKNAENGRVKIHNEAIVTENWESGYKTSHRVSADYTVEVPTGGGTPGFEKISFDTVKNASVHAPAQRHGGQEDILDDGKEVPLGWRISYGGGPEKEPIWDKDSHTYTAQTRTICITDGTEDNLLYSSGNADEKYNWNPSSGNKALSDEDYRLTNVTVTLTEYDAECLDETADRWTGTKEHVDRADYENVDIYVRYKDSKELEFFRSVTFEDADKVSVSLPENARGIKILHDSSFYWTDIRVDLTANLLPSAAITKWFREDAEANTTSIIKNWARCKMWTGKNENEPYKNLRNYNENGFATREVWELDVSVTDQLLCKSATNQSGVVVDVKHGIQDNPMCLTGWLYNNSGRVKQLRTGEFYDLLPMGTTVDPASVYGVSFVNTAWSTAGAPGAPANNYYTKLNDRGRLPNSALDVSFVDNWEGSHRTMMIVRFTVPENVKANGVHIFFLLRTTYENIMENGSTQENDAAFVNTSKWSSPPRSTGVALSELEAKEYFQELDKQYNGKISYFEASAHYAPVDVSTWGFDKLVKAETSASYSQRDTSLLNNLYTYRLTYSQGSGTRTKGIVFLDVLEYGFYEKAENEPGFRRLVTSEWQGVFVDVNVESVRKNRMDKDDPNTACAPVVYYSTKKREEIQDVKPNFDVTDGTWSQIPPTDIKEITAIAVDCSKCENDEDFELMGDDSAMEIYITMRAPVDAALETKTARNRAAVYMTHVDSKSQETSVMMDAGASVTLQDVEPELQKTADPGSGTEEKPAAVYKDDPLTYTLTVTNGNQELPLKDIVLTDTIPDGLSVQNADIRVRFGNDRNTIPVSESPRVIFERNGRDLTFTIRNLYAGESAYVEITGTVTASAGTVLKNQARITSVNDVKKELTSDETYHKVEPIGFSISKVGAGGRPLAGAVLELWKRNEGVSADAPFNEENYTLVQDGRWPTTGETKRFENLDAGTYVIHEVKPPDGHLQAEDITVELDNVGNLRMDGNIIHGVTMRDDCTKLCVEKKDSEGKAVIGAKLEIYELKDFDMTAKEPNAGSKCVAKWTTNGRPHELDGVVNPNAYYVLYEREAPENYRKARPVEFYVETSSAPITIVMADPFAAFDVRVQKVDTKGDPLPRAKLRITGKRTDTVSAENIEKIEWETTRDDYVIKLHPGTYTLSEVYAPDGYALAEPIEFTVEEDTKNNKGIVKVKGAEVEAATLIMTDKRAQDLTVTKTVRGEVPSGTEGQKYSFTLSLTEAGKPFQGRLAYEISNSTSGSGTGGTGTGGTSGSGSGAGYMSPDTVDGLYHFELAHGERITFFDVPQDLDYVVSEITGSGANYVVTIDDETGGITGADAPALVNVTNTYPQKGDLLITKMVVGTWAPEGTAYTMEITPAAGTEGGAGSIVTGNVEVFKMSSAGTWQKMTAPGVSIEEDKITVQLKDGEQIQVKGLADGTYMVKEQAASGETGDPAFTAAYRVDAGNFAETDGTAVTVNNTKMGSVEVRNTYSNLGELTVSKKVAGSSAPESAWYHVRVASTATSAFRNYKIEILADPAGSSGKDEAGSSGEDEADSSGEGTAEAVLQPRVASNILSFRLRRDCQVKISGLPVGMYTVTEAAVGSDCKAFYTVTVNRVKGTSSASGVVALGSTTTAGQRITFGSVEILNRYPDKTSLKLTGTKAVIGKEKVENKYHFAVEAESNPGDGALLPEKARDVRNNGDKIDFGEITFTKSGTYVFKVRETGSDDILVGTDSAVYTLTVTVAARQDDTEYACEIEKVVIERQESNSKASQTVAAFGTSGETEEPIPEEKQFVLPEKTEEGKTASFINRVKQPLEMPDTGGPGTLPITRISMLLCLAGCILILLAKRRKPRGSR